VNTGSRPVSRVIFLIAGIIATLTTILIPAGYFTISYQYLLGNLEAQAELNARAVSDLVRNNPNTWRYEEVRLMELLERHPLQGGSEKRRILDLQGNVIADSETIHPKAPLVSVRHNIHDAGLVVAKIEITRSLAPLIFKTLLVTIAALILGGVVLALLRIFPMRIIEKSRRSLEESEKKYRALYDSMKEGLALLQITNGEDGHPASFTVIDVNPACALIVGQERDAIIGNNCSEFLGGAMTDLFPEILRLAETVESLTFEISLPHEIRIFNVSVFFPAKDLFATLLEDITQRKEDEQQIKKLAFYDNLTGLPNRVLLLDRLNQSLARAIRSKDKVAVLFLDLDRFKIVNDTMGHACGDLLLVQVSQRLSGVLRSSDTLARLGGDEFVIVISCTGEERNVAYVTQQFLEKLTPPYLLDNKEVYSTASIGIAMYPEDALDAETLLRCADLAMYASKEGGRNSYHFYSSEMNRKAHERMELETDLRHALEREEFFLEFQPIIHAEDESITSAEVLVRWLHPERGRTVPATFIQVAEESGLIIPLGNWVLRTACMKVINWRDAGHPEVRLSVNVSGRQFAQRNFTDEVFEILTETGVDPRLIELEMTETCLMENEASTTRTLNKLKEFGFGIAIDDFGAGYSSLGYVKNFPIDRIKIDRSFIKDVCNNKNDQAIVEAIIAMAHKLQCAVTAEGIELPEQAAFLRDNGCDEIQGYHYHKPLSEEVFVALLQSSWGRSG
jgi:diguanylate cyclase (GGDEF)-like protein